MCFDKKFMIVQIIIMYGDIWYFEVILQMEIFLFGIVVCFDCVWCQDFIILNISVVFLDWCIVIEKSYLDMVECVEFDGFVNWVCFL